MDEVPDIMLPSGLTLHTLDESLETSESNVGDVKLLAITQGLELLKGRLQKGYRLHLYPAKNNQHPTEIYFLLHGSLQYESKQGIRVVNPGDYIIAQDLQGPMVFTAQTDIEFLFITTQPAFHEISRSLKMLKDLTIELASKDSGETEDHCKRMRKLSYAMGKQLQLSQHQLHLLDYAAYFHDVGKIKVPDSILKKPAALNPQEWQIIKQHPNYGRELLEQSFIQEAGIIVEQHHERLDGSGYPNKLTGNSIRTEAYIIAVADSYDAMTSDRPYRRALSQRKAFDELANGAGYHYPEQIVHALELTLNYQGI